MKRTKTKSVLLAFVAMTVLAFQACNDSKRTEGPTGGDEILADGAVLQGELTKNIKLTKGNTYILKDAVHVKAPYTLTIEEGVTVKADIASTAYLLVEPGAKIEAVGTDVNPIVFTSSASTPKPQDWGGIILCGRAPINVEGGKAASEMGTGVVYGGADANDNSGTLKYVRVEFTGKKQTAEKEHNGFTFEGVGRGTTLEHLSVYKGGDDGIEFFGGTVDLKYAVVFGAQDDLFDWTYGWSGRGQYWVGIQDDDVADRGIEADNSKENNTASPFSNPTLSNVTLVGSLLAKTGDDPNTATETGKTRAMKLREGTQGQFFNFVMYNFNSGVEVEHDVTLEQMTEKKLTLMNSDLYGAKLWSYKHSDGKVFEGTNPFEGADYKVSTGTGKPSYITDTYIGTNSSNAIDPMTLDSFFESAPYKGAVSADNNWVKKGSWARL